MKFTFFVKNVRCSDGSKGYYALDLTFDQLLSLISPSKLCKLFNSSDVVYEKDKPISFTRRNLEFVNISSFFDLSSGHSSKEPKKD